MRIGRERSGRAARIMAGCMLLVLVGCGLPREYSYPVSDGRRQTTYTGEVRESVFGPGGLSIGGADKPEVQSGGGIGVNSFLWRASLDTLSFMPLASADPFGGVIITDWYSPPDFPEERFKITVYILVRQLRADGIKVAAFRQELRGTDSWRDAAVAKETATDLENAILTRARQLRIAAPP